MAPDQYEAAQKQLFSEIEQKLKRDVHVGIDGAVEPARYFASRPKVLFVLKEMNESPWAPQNLVKLLRSNVIPWKTWNNIVRWRNAIHQVMNHDRGVVVASFEQDAAITSADRRQALSDVAVMNMKKMPGGSTSNWPTIEQHAKHFSQELGKQIAMLDPDVIVACGVWLKSIEGFLDLKESMAKKERAYLLHPLNGRTRIVIYTDHSQAFKSSENMLDGVVQACYAAKEELGPR